MRGEDMIKESWHLKNGVVVYVPFVDNMTRHSYPVGGRNSNFGLGFSSESLDSIVKVAKELNLPLPTFI